MQHGALSCFVVLACVVATGACSGGSPGGAAGSGGETAGGGGSLPTGGAGGHGGGALVSASRSGASHAGAGGAVGVPTSSITPSTRTLGPLPDAGSVEAGTTGDCEVEGVPGTCMDTAACTALANHAPTPGFCLGPSTIQCCIPDQTALCDPSVMEYPNAGNTTEAPGEGGCPAGMILITPGSPALPFCIDTYEATLVRVDNGASWSPFVNPGTTSVMAVSVAGAVPQGYIDGLQAGDACTNAGKRLCTDTEWLRACRGPKATTYPYGNARETGVCNDHRAVHPAVEYFGTTASWIYSHLTNACLNQLADTVDLTGSLSGCVTADGAYDMMGNLHEWTADPAGTFRGGYFMDTVLNGNGCLYATTAHDTSYWDYSTGFRCCADTP